MEPHVFFTFSRVFSGGFLVPSDSANGRYTKYTYYPSEYPDHEMTRWQFSIPGRVPAQLAGPWGPWMVP